MTSLYLHPLFPPCARLDPEALAQQWSTWLAESTAAYLVPSRRWRSTAMITCLLDSKAAVALAKPPATSLSHFQVRTFRKRYQENLEQACLQNPLDRSLLGNKRGLAKKTKPNRSQVQAFLTDFNVPFDNNLAERDIRMIKVQQKISSVFRSEDGVNTFCRIRSYISTARKNALGALQRIFTRTPFVPLPHPSSL